MAALPSVALMPVEVYLNSSWSPDREYVDGVLIERCMPNLAHGRLQKLAIANFLTFENEFGFETLPNVRTRIVEGARYRIPDLLLCPTPVPNNDVLTTVPWVVIEILSPGDKLWVELDRYQEFAQIGVRHIVLLDPKRRLAYRYEDGSIIKTHFTSLDLPTGPVPFDSDELFRKLVEKQK